MKKLILFGIIIFSLANICIAQQSPLYTNYRFNQFAYNPALAGQYDYLDARFSFRDQWANLKGAPKSQLLSLNSRVKELPLGLGGMFHNDKTGHLRRLGLSTSIAYVLDLKKGGKFSAGISGGVFNIQLGTDINIQNPNDVTVINSQDGKWVPDAGLGLYYSVKGFYTGFSIPQIFQSDVDFSSVNQSDLNNLVRHYFLVLGNEFKIGEKLKLDPSIMLKAVKAAPTQVDIAFVTTLYDLFWFGPSYRSGDAFNLMAGFNIKNQFEIGYSYDITTSELNNFSNGSHEFVLKYKLTYRKDTDKDGVYDKKDKCPEEPGLVENEGCPLSDTDGDGLNDEIDECPKTVGPVENLGCPVVADEEQQLIDSVLVNLEFEYDNANMKEFSKPYLDRLAILLVSKPDWVIKLTGHTDNKGTPEYNMNLSRDRANAVMFYLLSKGVFSNQVTVEYYGDTKPIATNETEEGRQVNRRVEMEFVFD